MSYDKTNTGTLFKNHKKTTDKHPDYRGKIFIDPSLAGRQVEIAAWIKTAGAQAKTPGANFLSLRVSEPFNASKHGNTDSSRQSTDSTQNNPDFDDKLPF